MSYVDRLLLGTLLVLCSAAAQTSTGQIAGTVLDSSGAVVPNATVRIIGSETGEVAREQTTNEFGAFVAPLLRPSLYTVEVSAPGFKKLVRAGVSLNVDDALNLRLALEPGTIAESIEVSAAAELLEERTSSVGQVVTDQTMQQLPLNGRNYLQLGNLSAGAVPNTRSRDRTFSAYGNRGLQNAFLLDGARNQNYLRGLDNRQRDAMRPSLEAISEFKVQTSNYSAEYGASAGAVVNVVTKSGTNEIHGSVFEFHRNSAVDARDYFLPRSADRPLYIQHQFGGSLGGFFVRNRAWWHAAYQRTHISEGETNTSTVPLPAEKMGVFGRPIFDPLTTRPNPNGTGFIRDPFPNNTIPTDRMDPRGRALLERYPDPNLPGAARNYVGNPLQATRANNLTTRGDLSLTTNDTVFVRFSLEDGTFRRLPALPLGAQTGTDRETPARSIGGGYTRVITPSLINELRLAYNYVAVRQDATLERDEIIAGSLDERVQSSIPTFNVNGYAGLGAQPTGFGNVPLDKQSKVWNISDNLSWIHGAHTLKFGFDMQHIQVPTFSALQGRGSFGFTGVFSQNPQSRGTTGSSVADLLLGLPNTINIGSPSDAEERATNYYWYVQDDWAISRSFTLNIGLRYELTRPFYEVNNKLANIVLDDGHELYGQYLLAGDPRIPRSMQETDYNNFAPRLGFAWKPGLGTVLRGGFGIFFAQDEGFGVSQRMTNNPPFVGFGGYNLVSDQLQMSSTIPLAGQLPPRPTAPDPSTFEFDPNSTAQIRSWPSRFTIPYVQQWNLSLQKQITSNLLWEVNYVGNRGVKLWGVYEGNQPFPGPGSVNDRRPLGGVVTRASVLRFEPWVNSTYHGLSTRLERRFAQGLQLLAVYTFGRSLDDQTNVDLCDGCAGSGGAGSVMDTRNRSLNYGLSDHHTAHRFVLSGLYELPFGPGRAYIQSGALGHVLGGWGLSGITTLSSGLPYTLTLNFDNSNTGTTNRPDRIARGTLDDPTVDRWFDTSAFTFPAQYTFGNAGRNILTGPGMVSTDISLQRNFSLPINEGSRLEFRAEAFNVFNTPQLGTPGGTLGTPAFGVIGETARPNRQLQLGMRLLF